MSVWTLRIAGIIFLLQLLATGCSTSSKVRHGHDEGSATVGEASWYGGKFHGRRTASGEIYNQNQLTAAHRTLPFGTRVRVTHLANNKSVIVKINDRGPYAEGRIIDLSYHAAKEIGLAESGVGRVKIEVLGP